MTQFADGLAHDLPGPLAEFGRVVVYTPQGGITREIVVLVGERGEPAEFGELRGDGVQVWLRDIGGFAPELAQGDSVKIGETDYTVNGIEPARYGRPRATLIRA